MDAHVTLPSSKKQQLGKDHAKDIISNLPESVLNYVLSFLSTKDVIQTSVLSRRWRYLWTSVATIDLEDGSYLDVSSDSFIETVNRVITLHDDSAIERLRLCLHLPSEFPRFNSWIRVALSHNVEELDLFLYCNEQSELPFCLFTSRSLISLRISAKLTLKPPPSPYFIKLRKLHLFLVSFSDDVSTERIFSNCPVLEELALKDCDWKHIQNVTISIPTLKSLTIVVSYHGEAGLDRLINIFCSNITYLYCHTDLNVDICICNLPSLDKAYVELPWSEEVMDILAYRGGRIFSAIYNVKSLRISNDVLWSIMEIEDMRHHIPIFHKLTHLEVGSEEPPSYIQLVEFLNKTPKLVYLNLFESYEDESSDSEDEELLSEEDKIPDNVPSCFSSSLKLFSFSYFEGNPKEMELASFVLKNAIILERMTICCAGNLSEDENKRILVNNQLNELKVSESCVIELHEDSEPLL